MASLEQFLVEVQSSVDSTLDTLIPAAEAEPATLHQAIRWSVFAGGKRIRPVVLYAAGRTFEANVALLSRSAAAVEMIHTYSLIHDDLPAMDDDDLRRGKPSCHIKFGEATAILAGDALQALAFGSIAEDDQLSAEVRVQLISELAAASGTPVGMVSGQQLDLEGEGRSLSIDKLERIHNQKTGALIAAAARMGAIVGGASSEEITAIGKYALKLGLLFQITDDLLDITQETAVLGKTAGKDATAEKATYPAFYGVERSFEIASEIFDSACESLASVGRETQLLKDIGRLVMDRSK